MTYVAVGAVSQRFIVQLAGDSGLPITGLVAAGFPTTYYQRDGEAPVQITLTNLAAQTSAYSSGGVKELTGGYYRLDVPNAAFATAARVRLIGEASGKHLLHPLIDCGIDLSDVVTVLPPPGGVEWTVEILDEDDNPIADAQVWVTADEAGLVLRAGTKSTDDFGLVTFNLDPGDYYRWCDHSEFNFTNPQPMTVTAPTTTTPEP